MQFELDAARRFRESADLMRAVARGDTNIKASGLLDRIAEEYERTAAELEAVAAMHPDPAPPEQMPEATPESEAEPEAEAQPAAGVLAA